jgi:dihydroorotate dehydrogenase (fumarate)
MERYNIGPEAYLNHISALKKAVSIPIIASLNGISTGGWVDYASRMESAGADALELNFYDIQTNAKTDSATLEKTYIELVRSVRSKVKIPLAVKLSPFYTTLPNFTSRLVESGANGLVLFNRFIQPDLDIEDGKVVPHLTLSTSVELLLPLRWTAILHGRIRCDLALTGGVHTSEDMVKALMAGAKVCCIASELIEKGVGRAAELIGGLSSWMEAHEYTTFQQLIGSMSQKNSAEPSAFERANYMKALQSYDNRSF